MQPPQVDVDEVVILGAGGFGRELRCWYERVSHRQSMPRLAGFLDERTELHGLDLLEVPVLGGADWLASRRHVGVLLGVGLPRVKAAIVARLAEWNLTFPALVDPSANLGGDIRIGQGVVVCAGVTITTAVELQAFSMVNINATIGHDSVIGSFSTISPGANLSGYTRIGEGVDLGTGAITIPGKSIGAWSVVAAGAVVTADVPANVMVAGVPAVVRKSFDAGWHLTPPGR